MNLTPMQSFCLTAISREAPIATETITDDLETLWGCGQALDLRGGCVETTLRELVELELIVDTGAGWGLVEKEPVGKVLQRSLFA